MQRILIRKTVNTMASAVVLMTALVGCAAPNIPGVKITDEERQACAQSKDCTVWTEGELLELLEQVVRKTYEKAFENAVNGRPGS